MSDDVDSSTTFLRQRRDLFVISGILLLIPIAKIEGADSITMPFIGVSMHIGRPEVITYSLWLLWAYWYLRYSQAFMALNIDVISKFFSIISSNSFSNFHELAEIGKSEVKNIEAFDNDQNIGYSIEEKKFHLFKAEYLYTYSIYDPRNSTNLSVEKILIFKGLKYHINQVKAVFEFVFKNIEFTEYVFPFIFGISPLIYLFLYK